MVVLVTALTAMTLHGTPAGALADGAVEDVHIGPVPRDSGGASIYEGSTIAQTFTAGRSGYLTDLVIPGYFAGSFRAVLTDVKTGDRLEPGTTVLAAQVFEGVGWGGEALDQPVAFSSPALVEKGVMYALLVTVEDAGSGGLWPQATTPYDEGNMWFDPPDPTPYQWMTSFSEDMGLVTYVVPTIELDVTGPTAPVPTGSPHEFTVRAVDHAGNTLSDVSGEISLTTTDSAATMPGSVGLVSGVATFSVTFVTTGNQSVTGTTTATPTLADTSASIRVRLPAPANLVATPVSSNTIDLDWDPVPGAGEYQVLRAAAPEGPFVGAGKSTTDSLRIGGLSPGTTYYFMVRARDTAGLSRDSNQASATTVQAKPAAPTNLVATGRSGGRVALTWDAPPGTVTGYRVLRSTTPGGPYSLVTTKSTPACIVSGLTPGTAYYFVVQAKNSVGYSPLSHEATATPVS